MGAPLTTEEPEEPEGTDSPATPEEPHTADPAAEAEALSKAQIAGILSNVRDGLQRIAEQSETTTRCSVDRWLPLATVRACQRPDAGAYFPSVPAAHGGNPLRCTHPAIPFLLQFHIAGAVGVLIDLCHGLDPDLTPVDTFIRLADAYPKVFRSGSTTQGFWIEPDPRR